MMQILYEDDDVLAVCKPSGMLVHRGWAQDDVVLVDLVADYTGDVPRPIHRIDRQTSGVVLFAKSTESAAILNAQFDARQVEKVYLALVRGVPRSDSGTVDHPVPRTEGGERIDAQTSWRRLRWAETEPRHVSQIEARPITGRFHQIRRHLKHLNHPIIGDANYGKGKLNREFRERYGLDRLALHAAKLAFDHPAKGCRVEIEAPLSEDLVAAFEAMAPWK